MSDKQRLLAEILTEMAHDGTWDEDKIQSLGPLLFLCHRELTEKEFRGYIEELELDDYPLYALADYFNRLRASGVIEITEFESDTWADETSSSSLEAYVDLQLKELIKEMTKDKAKFEKLILGAYGHN
jgi:hypothetical protein